MMLMLGRPRSAASTSRRSARGQHTNLAIAEYWRWWVVHLWVEGFFEVFATVIIAFLFARLGLVRAASGRPRLGARGHVFLGGGMIGTLHHLYFTGTPTIGARVRLGVQRRSR